MAGFWFGQVVALHEAVEGGFFFGGDEPGFVAEGLVGAFDEADGFEDGEVVFAGAEVLEELDEVGFEVADGVAQGLQFVGFAEDFRAERLAVDCAAGGDDVSAEAGDDAVVGGLAGFVEQVDLLVGVDVVRAVPVGEVAAEQAFTAGDGAGDADDEGHAATVGAR